MTVKPDGAAVEARRLELGLSREGLGFAAGGVCSSTIRRIERNIGTPNRSTSAALARVLGDDLFPSLPPAKQT
jgi:hypothetical protein